MGDKRPPPLRITIGPRSFVKFDGGRGVVSNCCLLLAFVFPFFCLFSFLCVSFLLYLLSFFVVVNLFCFLFLPLLIVVFGVKVAGLHREEGGEAERGYTSRAFEPGNIAVIGGGGEKKKRIRLFFCFLTRLRMVW